MKRNGLEALNFQHKNEHYPNPTFEQQFNTGNAYNEMLKTKN